MSMTPVETLRGRALGGVAVDTWGVDYALLDSKLRVLGLPFHYRDERTHGAAGTRKYAKPGRVAAATPRWTPRGARPGAWHAP